MNRFTIYAAWGSGEDRTVEEVDVDAETREEARRLAEAELARDYMPGWRILDVFGPRVGWYL